MDTGPDHAPAQTRPGALTIADALPAALELAARGPRTGPNPRVGCILLAPAGSTALSAQPSSAQHNTRASGGVLTDHVPRKVLGFGWHRGAGTPHAEAAALTDAATRGNDVTGAAAVVSLEPCNHTGRTGPCSEALIGAGISELTFAVADPNPGSSGGGTRLSEAGVTVHGPTEAEGMGPAHDLLHVWLTAIRRGRPFVTLKLALSLDGRIAAVDGTSRWITSAESRTHAHDFRTRVDAIAVGTGTALIDDPSLTARPFGQVDPTEQPLRVVVGNRDVPQGARLRSLDGGELVQVRSHDVTEVLAELEAREVRHLLVEGGPTLAAAFLAADVVDEVHAYLAPVLLGAGRSGVTDFGVTSIDQALRLESSQVRLLGPDVLLIGAPGASSDDAPSAPVRSRTSAVAESAARPKPSSQQSRTPELES